MSSDPDSYINYGPYVPGFIKIPFGDAKAVSDAIDENTVAVLVEPIQGEAGVVVPPDGYLSDLRRICTEAGILFILDEIQTGLGRTGKLFACDHEGVRSDVVILGKALAGGFILFPQYYPAKKY